MRGLSIAILLLLFSLSAHAQDSPGCATTIKALRILAGDPLFSSRWSEISMDDGKPLVVSIVERNGALSLEFIKTGEGLWAEISGAICKTGADLELRTTKEQVSLGPAANWMLGLHWPTEASLPCAVASQTSGKLKHKAGAVVSSPRRWIDLSELYHPTGSPRLCQL